MLSTLYAACNPALHASRLNAASVQLEAAGCMSGLHWRPQHMLCRYKRMTGAPDTDAQLCNLCSCAQHTIVPDWPYSSCQYALQCMGRQYTWMAQAEQPSKMCCYCSDVVAIRQARGNGAMSGNALQDVWTSRDRSATLCRRQHHKVSKLCMPLLVQPLVHGAQVCQPLPQQKLKVSLVSRAELDSGGICINVHAMHLCPCITQPHRRGLLMKDLYMLLPGS